MKATSQILAAFAAATNNELFDADPRFNEWMVEAVETQETIEQFIESSAKWASCTKDQFGEIAGCKFVAWREVQVAKGQQRRALSVIDFSDFRMAINTDLANFA